ncbi:hypothetical protein [Brevibacterium linens]|uniref:hypothetical protein n=1 Tax=Brevibacterium linens TaxID=1703 RepID=UPI003F8C3F7F
MPIPLGWATTSPPLILGDRTMTLSAGEAAEFDTRTPHWFGGADHDGVEYLSLFGPEGQRVHMKS